MKPESTKNKRMTTSATQEVIAATFTWQDYPISIQGCRLLFSRRRAFRA